MKRIECHECDTECNRIRDEKLEELGWKVFKCPNCGEEFITAEYRP